MLSIVRCPLWRNQRLPFTAIFKYSRWKTSSTLCSYAISRHSKTELTPLSMPQDSENNDNMDVSAAQKLFRRSNIKKKKAPKKTRAENHSSPVDRLPSLVGAVPHEDEETQLTEADVRLAMRTLMEQHLSQRSTLNRIAEGNLKRRRRQEEMAHASRLRRIEEKTHNSMKLLGSDGTALGDGILPLFSHHSSNSSPLAKGSDSTSKMSDWRAYNPVSGSSSHEVSTSAEVEKVSDEWESKTLQSLCKPNLSVYDSERDIRIRSEDALREEKEMSQSAAAGVIFEGDDVVTENEITHNASSGSITGGNITLEKRPFRHLSTDMLRYELTGEEDADFPVHIYEEDND